MKIIKVYNCKNCPNKFSTLSNHWRCTIKMELEPLPEDGTIHEDCPLDEYDTESQTENIAKVNYNPSKK